MRHHCCCLVLGAFLVLFSEGYSSADTLLSVAHQLKCAENANDAEKFIRSIQGRVLLPNGLPNESAKASAMRSTAFALDKVLTELFRSSQKFPENHELIERTVIRWNFCKVIDNGRFYDHEFDGVMIRTPAALTSAYDWVGFKSFGLVRNAEHLNRFKYSTPYSKNTIMSLADIYFRERYISHCLPHPANNHLYRSDGNYFITRVVFESQPPSGSAGKDPECQADDSGHTAGQESVEVEQNDLAIEDKLTNAHSQAGDIQILEPESVIKAVTTPLATNIETTINSKSETLNTSANKLGGHVVAVTPLTRNSVSVPVRREHHAETSPAAVVVFGPPGADAINNTAVNHSKRVSGSISLENRSFDSQKTSVKLAVAYKIFKNSFWSVQTALDISADSEPVTYSWGVGYNDWHPGTLAVQLNHWGPLKPGGGLDIKNSIAKVSYKFDKKWLTDNKLSGSLALSKSLSGKPVLSLGGAWSPRSHWFVRSTVVRPLTSGSLEWSYGFGYARYSKNSLSLEYNNWGVNNFPDHNFRKNGRIGVVYRWAF